MKNRNKQQHQLDATGSVEETLSKQEHIYFSKQNGKQEQTTATAIIKCEGSIQETLSNQEHITGNKIHRQQ